MSALWLAVGAGSLVVAMTVWRWAASRGGPPDLGYVSEQWLSEHRLSTSADAQR